MSVTEPLELVGEVERLLEEIEQLPDSSGRQAATEVVQALLDLYGAGLERIVEEVALRDDGELAQALGDDELVAHLLLLHGLHPVPLSERVKTALGEVRPYLESHGGNVELLAVEGSTVRLRMEGSCKGCPSSAMTLKLAIEDAIHKAAPEIESVVAEEDAQAATGPGLPVIPDEGAPAAESGALLQIQVVPRAATGSGAAPPPPIQSTWNMVGGLPELAGGGITVKPVGGRSILFLKAGDCFLGYLPECPACGASLSEAELRASELKCPACEDRYDVLRAGRGLDAPALHLEPVPLLVGDDGLVRVAQPVAA